MLEGSNAPDGRCPRQGEGSASRAPCVGGRSRVTPFAAAARVANGPLPQGAHFLEPL